jgi:cell division protein FtsB
MQIADIYSKMDGVISEMLPEIQGRLDQLGLRVDSLEGRIAANETAIALLDAENEALWAQIAALIAKTDDIDGTLAAALDQLAGIAGEIEALQSQDGDHTAAIQALIADGEAQWQQIYLNSEDVASLKGAIDDNASKMTYLQMQIDELRSEMISYHDCPEGATRRETTDGWLVCDDILRVPLTITPASFVQPPCKITYNPLSITCPDPYVRPKVATGAATCPEDTVLVTGGYEDHSAMITVTSSLPNGSSWEVTAENRDLLSSHTVTIVAQCASYPHSVD